jgi:hypothetical protein
MPISNINRIAASLFEKVRGRFNNVKIDNEESVGTQEPEEARFFAFNYVSHDGEEFGAVKLSLEDPTKLVVLFSKSITNKLDEKQRKEWYAFLRSLRLFAKRQLLGFTTQDITRGVSESKMTGTRKSSYQPIGKTKLIIRHSDSVDESIRGARSRHIASIFVEDKEGNRYRLPFTHLTGARAMARHVAEGGVPYDSFGSHICELVEGLVDLRSKMRAFTKDQLVEGSETLVEYQTVKEQYGKLQHDLHSLKGSRSYRECKDTWNKGTEMVKEVEEFTEWADSIAETYESDKKYGVKYKMFAGKEGRLTTKEKWFATDAARAKFIEKLENTDGFYELDGYSDPKQGVTEGIDTKYPDTTDGVISFANDFYGKNFVRLLDLPTCKFIPDPSVEGVWAIDSIASGYRCIVYLAGYKDPWGQIRPQNDAEEGSMPKSKVQRLIEMGEVNKDTLKKWVRAGSIGKEDIAKYASLLDESVNLIEAPSWAKATRSYVKGSPDDPEVKEKERNERRKEKRAANKEDELAELRTEPIEQFELADGKLQNILDAYPGIGGGVNDVTFGKSGYITVRGKQVAAIKVTVQVAIDLADMYDQETIDTMYNGETSTLESMSVIVHRNPNNPEELVAKYI